MLTRHRMVLSLSLLAGVVLVSTTPLSPFTARGSQDRSFDGPYCGLYAVYAAARLNGLPPQVDGVRRLLRPEFLGSPPGASTRELVAAARELGMTARPFAGLTRFDLMAASDPVVLHVKAHPAADAADHWVLLIQATPTEAVLIDGSDTPIREPLNSLAARWDGLAIFISNGHVSSLVRWPTLAVVLAGLAATLAVPFALSRLAMTVLRVPGSTLARELIVFTSATILVGLLFAGLSPSQPGRASVGRQAVIDRHLNQFLPSVDTAELARRLREGAPPLALVDARDSGSYELGHIPGAISLPVYANDEALAGFVRSLRSEHQVVIYCQSERCTFSAVLAARLRKARVTRIALYHGGWEAWETHQPVTKNAAGWLSE